jgi:hypothetical protein
VTAYEETQAQCGMLGALMQLQNRAYSTCVAWGQAEHATVIVVTVVAQDGLHLIMALQLLQQLRRTCRYH